MYLIFLTESPIGPIRNLRRNSSIRIEVTFRFWERETKVHVTIQKSKLGKKSFFDSDFRERGGYYREIILTTRFDIDKGPDKLRSKFVHPTDPNQPSTEGKYSQ